MSTGFWKIAMELHVSSKIYNLLEKRIQVFSEIYFFKVYVQFFFTNTIVRKFVFVEFSML